MADQKKESKEGGCLGILGNLVIWGFGGLAVLLTGAYIQGTYSFNNNIKKCNQGIESECESLVKYWSARLEHEEHKGKVTNPDFESIRENFLSE